MQAASLLVALLALFFPLAASAHTPSDGFLTLDVEGTALSGQLDLALKDLALIVDLDADADGRITWGELKAQRAALEAYVAPRLALSTPQGRCMLEPLDLQVSDYSDGAYASLIFNTTCKDHAITAVDVRYDLVFDVDAQHRGLLHLTYRDEAYSHAFGSTRRDFRFDPGAGGWERQLATFVREGMKHIFHGYDHMLFLVALLLPAVFLPSDRRRLSPQNSLHRVLVDTAKVITGFTVAHSLSLCLTTFDVIAPPPARLVETLVALTILLTALNNVFVVVAENRWLVGFGFGLVHGIGYASVLADLGLTGWSLASPLIGFNLGVEAAQLIVIAAFLPFAYLLRRTNVYRSVFLWGGSFATALFAVGWMVEQIAHVSFMPF